MTHSDATSTCTNCGGRLVARTLPDGGVASPLGWWCTSCHHWWPVEQPARSLFARP
jgi:hypothetical protein